MKPTADKARKVDRTKKTWTERNTARAFETGDETLDQMFDAVLRKLIVLGSIDALVDVDFADDPAAIFFFMDAAAKPDEINKLLQTLQAVYPGTDLAAEPETVLDDGKPSEWWILYVPKEPADPTPLEMVQPEEPTGEKPVLGYTPADAVKDIAQGIDVDKAVDSLLKSESVVEATVTIKVPTPDRALDTTQLVQRVKSYGGDAQGSYGLFVKARDLNPEIDMKAFREIWDRVGPNSYIDVKTINFVPTHKSKSNPNLTIMVTQRTPDAVRYVLSYAGTGSDPAGLFDQGYAPLGESVELAGLRYAVAMADAEVDLAKQIGEPVLDNADYARKKLAELESALGAVRPTDGTDSPALSEDIAPGDSKVFDKNGLWAIQRDASGYYTAIAPSASKNFQTYAAAVAWLKNRNPDINISEDWRAHNWEKKHWREIEQSLTPEHREVMKKAEAEGRRAFHAGIPSTPALNPAVMDLVKQVSTGGVTGVAAFVLQAYINGWTAENLKAPVPESVLHEGWNLKAYYDWVKNLKEGDTIEARWTHSGFNPAAKAVVIRLNAQSIRVKLLEPVRVAYDLGWSAGQEIRLPRPAWGNNAEHSPYNGPFPADKPNRFFESVNEAKVDGSWPKSKGHLAFLKGSFGPEPFEYYLDARGDLWRAPVGNVIDVTNGYRIGRWEAPKHLAQQMFDQAVKAFSESVQITEQKEIDPVELAVRNFLFANPKPSDKEFHAFADREGIEHDKAEAVAYRLAARLIAFLRGGRSKGERPARLSDGEAAAAIEVEAEHADDLEIQRKIGYDHDTEFSNYYLALSDLEKQLKQGTWKPLSENSFLPLSNVPAGYVRMPGPGTGWVNVKGIPATDLMPGMLEQRSAALIYFVRDVTNVGQYINYYLEKKDGSREFTSRHRKSDVVAWWPKPGEGPTV